MNINSIRGKKKKKHWVISCPWFSPASYCGYSRKKNWQLHCNFRIFHGNLSKQCIQERQKHSMRWCNVTLLIYKDISHMPITELENNSESVWVKVFANKTSHFLASWYRQSVGTSEDVQLFRDQLDHIRNQHTGKTLPSVHVLEDFNFKDIDWPGRLNKSGSALSHSEGQMFIDIMNDHGLEVHFPTRQKKKKKLLFLVNFRIFTPRTNSVIMTLFLEPWKLSFLV